MAAPDLSLTGVPLAVRPGRRLQVGSSPRSGSVVGPLDAEDVTALLTLAVHGPAASSTAAGARRAAALLRELTASGAVSPGRLAAGVGRLSPGPTSRWAPDAVAWAAFDPGGPPGPERLAGRRRQQVAVVGAGRTGAGLAAVLSAAGVGRVVVEDPGLVEEADLSPLGTRAEHVGARRGSAAEAVAAEVAVPAPGRRAGAARSGTDAAGPGADLVVLVDHHAARSAAAQRLLAEDVPHLSVVVRDTDALVGPLVVPGRTACLRCLDLHRTDADPGWPLALDQLSGTGAGTRQEETATATLLAGLVALQVLAHLDGLTPPARGATLEVLLPEGVVQVRRWVPHPECGCVDLPLVVVPAG
ncbi:TOMM precursor leader peptide-binding protein [Kineococcus sp. R8]|uniref:TOMM precursor leader peptide-binding protein n=1 Tax=Kineococcus siccus TaxID=2696567 RepID=UPI001411B96C|nr:TOMM precursor leader peptide-binding protein [Kineococcus siccus]NAZ83325.1 TOMM precursor leader peptide-binding protein [Kineococcus siccus]